MNLFKDARTKTRSFFIGALIKASRKICGPFNGSHGRCAFSKKNQLNTGPLRMRFLEGSASQRDASQLMGRKSLRSQKSIYQKSREKAGLTRKQASEKIVYLSENQLEKMRWLILNLVKQWVSNRTWRQSFLFLLSLLSSLLKQGITI